MQLILVRHGEAERMTRRDEARQLTERGLQQARWIAQQLSERLRPDVLVVSPLLRAKQTLAPLQAYFPEVAVHQCEAIKPDDPAAAAIDALAQYQGQCVVVVCHMNVIANMAALLTDQYTQGFGLAEARCFELPEVLPHTATELWALNPPSF